MCLKACFAYHYQFIAAVGAAVQHYTEHIARPIQRRNYINRDRAKAQELLFNDYFSDAPTYNEAQFRRRFRMSRPLFRRISSDLLHHDEFFEQKYDARGKLGFTYLQKCTSAIRQLAYSTCADSWDEYLKMSDKTSRDSLDHFCKGIICLYHRKYMRRPNFYDVQQLYHHHEEHHGFPGMLGSIDCMHVKWDNCPTAWKGQYQRGDHDKPTIMLEAVASQDLWIWHSFFGVAGSNNDINVLNQSPLFNTMENGTAPGSSFYCNDTFYRFGYYLTDGIYPKYATFVKSFSSSDATNEKRTFFKTRQESACKDIERAFGVLKKRWNIIANPTRAWMPNKIRNAMYACLILHNMILEDEGRAICVYYNEPDENQVVEISDEERQENRAYIHNEVMHTNLKTDLIEYLWVNRPRRNPDSPV